MKPHPTRRQATALFVAALTSFTLSPSRAADAEAIVKDIRERYNRIEGAKLRPQEIEFSSDSDPVSGTFTRYFQGNSLVKIKLSYGMGDHGGSEEYYYYDAGGLFFAFATDSAWGFSGETLPNGESGTIDTAIEHRAYFFDGSLVRHLSREAKSKDPAAISALLKKATNQPSSDSDRANRLYSVGHGAYAATSGATILRLLVE